MPNRGAHAAALPVVMAAIAISWIALPLPNSCGEWLRACACRPGGCISSTVRSNWMLSSRIAPRNAIELNPSLSCCPRRNIHDEVRYVLALMPGLILRRDGTWLTNRFHERYRVLLCESETRLFAPRKRCRRVSTHCRTKGRAACRAGRPLSCGSSDLKLPPSGRATAVGQSR